ncbi:PREDICTED: methylosome protein 50-like [Dinoponera quadriceps]|uniref:Methylosome protein 50-like n=1 Tax=Dinoponera quadriceps TaxID=609295 RepID=A0A6P3XPT5_DINQU|nr:PREDICTED: methylosome protein 50-like [Dinoponera quadriceps]
MIKNIPNLVDQSKKMFKETLSTSRNAKNYPQFLVIEDHKALLGSLEMSSISWSGSLRYFNGTSNFNKENAALLKETYDCCGDAAFLARDTFVVVGDKGAVEIFQIIPDDQEILELQSLNYARYHDDSVYAVSVLYGRKNIVTGGLDCCIKVWDVENLVATHSYSFAHTDCITGTDVKPMCDSTFASTSLDGDLSFWDIRQSKPVYCTINRKQKYYSISWNTAMAQFVAIGGDCGMIELIDVRQPDEPLFNSCLDTGSVWKVLFNPDRTRKNQLACCFDSTFVRVLDISKEMRVVMEDNKHTDYVRGLAWCEGDLFSCAWDDNVIKRTIPLSDSNDSNDNIDNNAGR